MFDILFWSIVGYKFKSIEKMFPSESYILNFLLNIFTDFFLHFFESLTLGCLWGQNGKNDFKSVANLLYGCDNPWSYQQVNIYKKCLLWVQ